MDDQDEEKADAVAKALSGEPWQCKRCGCFTEDGWTPHVRLLYCHECHHNYEVGNSQPCEWERCDRRLVPARGFQSTAPRHSSARPAAETTIPSEPASPRDQHPQPVPRPARDRRR